VLKADEATQSQREMAKRLKDFERKIKNLEVDLSQTHEETAAAERARKSAESERDELLDEISSVNSRA